MNEPLVIAILIGTTREQRQSHKAAHFIADYGRSLPNVEIILVDPNDFTFNGDGNDPEGKDPRYSEITERADAFFIVTPEYNHSFSGSLKRMLDSELQTYNHKPVALAGTSSGAWGGVRAVESLVPAIRETGLVVLSWDMYFPHVQDLFEADGALKPEYLTRYTASVQKIYDELLTYARLFKQLRADQKSA